MRRGSTRIVEPIDASASNGHISVGRVAFSLAATGLARIRERPPLCVAIVAVISAWALIFEVPRFIGLVSANAGANDFRLFYIAAEAGMRWDWTHMYDPAHLGVLSSGLGEGNDINSAYTYVNPPLVAWLTVPLTILPLGAAFYVWTAMNIAALCVAWRLAAPGTGFTRIAVLLGSLAIWPAVYALERGQPILLTYALAIAAWWMAGRNRQIEAGVLLALGWAMKPQDLALMPLVFVLCGLWRATLWWLLASAALWGFFALVLGPTGMATYLAVLLWVETNPQHLADSYAIVVGPGVVLAGAAVAMVLLTAAAVWRQRANWDVAFALGLIGTVVAGIHVHEYDYFGLVVAAWLVLRHPTPTFELTWMACGVLLLQVLSVGNRLPILFWLPVWSVMLGLRVQVAMIRPNRKSSRGLEQADRLALVS